MGDKSAREILADAIQAEADAREALKDAQSAASRASTLIFDMMSVVDDLERQIAEADRNPAALIETLAAGGGVAELVQSSSALRQKLEAKRAEIETLRQARDAAEQEVPHRQNWPDHTQRKVAAAAGEVVSAETDVDRLIAEATKAQASVLALRVQLMALSRSMSDGAARTRVADFMAAPWLAEMLNEGWTQRPEAVRVSAWAAALRRDAGAERPPL